MAAAFRPVLPGMLAATYARGGQTEEVQRLFYAHQCNIRPRQGLQSGCAAPLSLVGSPGHAKFCMQSCMCCW